MLSTCAILGVLLVPLTGCEQVRLDAEVRRLCAIDGGIKVYETVVLPADQFDSRGRVRIRGDKVFVDPGYTLAFQQHYYKKGDVPRGHISSLLQVRTAITRNSDGKLMGDSRIYERGGGELVDLLGGAPSHFECPAIAESGEDALAERVFIRATAPSQVLRANP